MTPFETICCAVGFLLMLFAAIAVLVTLAVHIVSLVWARRANELYLQELYGNTHKTDSKD